MFAELDAEQRELLARALDSFVGDVGAAVIPGVTPEQAEQLRSAVFPEVPTARRVDRALLCGHPGCGSRIGVLQEDGYLRDWTLRVDPDGFTAVDPGLAAYSETGSEEFTGICDLGHRNDVPDDVYQRINWA